MTRDDDGFAELREIFEALCEERLTSEQTARLEELTRQDVAARRFYLEYIELHGNLHWDAAQGYSAVVDESSSAAEEADQATRGHASHVGTVSVSKINPAAVPRRSRTRFGLTVVAGAAIAASFMAAAWFWRPSKPDATKRPFVTEQQGPGLRQENALTANDLKQPHANVPAGVAESERPKPSALSKTTTATTGASRRRPTQLQLAVAKNNKSTVNDSSLPQEAERSPVCAPSLPVHSSTSGTASSGTVTSSNVDDQRQKPARLVAYIDARIQAGWKSAGLEPSPLATDEEWIRRVYLDVIGHIPPEEAVDAFLDNNADHKRRAVVDHLLQDPGYARNWSTVWTNLLVGRQPGTPGVHREDLEKFLRESFTANVPWNEVVYALVAAEGTADQNPAANFLLAHLNQDAVPATALTARLFLGIQVQCTQCHDHPFTKEKQDRFWELNSFFQQTEVVSRAPLSTETASSERASMATRSSAVPEIVTRQVGGPIYYETLKGEMRAAFPIYAGHKIDAAPGINRRRELARLMAQGDDRQLAMAMVNRTWQHFFGQGFTRPVDDMGPHNTVNNPDVLDRLAKEFVSSGYDLKQLIRSICATDAYQRTSVLEPGNSSDDPATGSPALFSRVYLKPLSAEELYDSLLVATRAKASARTDWNNVGRRREDWVRQFVYSYATEDHEESALPAGSVSQALTMMNDRIVAGALAIEPGTLLFDVVHDETDDSAKIRRLARSALSRNPSQSELRAAVAHLREARKSARSEKSRDQAIANALADVFWAYLNANEFAFCH
jgi:hypothetical protein